MAETLSGMRICTESKISQMCEQTQGQRKVVFEPLTAKRSSVQSKTFTKNSGNKEEKKSKANSLFKTPNLKT